VTLFWRREDSERIGMFRKVSLLGVIGARADEFEALLDKAIEMECQ
jgi:hypothetical protein